MGCENKTGPHGPDWGHACGEKEGGRHCGLPDHDLATAYKALGHPVRLMILSKLATCSEQCCGDICSSLPLAQSTVSQHLKVLRQCGFIRLETAGQQSYYRLNQDRVDWFTASNDRFFKKLGLDETCG